MRVWLRAVAQAARQGVGQPDGQRVVARDELPAGAREEAAVQDGPPAEERQQVVRRGVRSEAVPARVCSAG
jgi:hypothetical protein